MSNLISLMKIINKDFSLPDDLSEEMLHEVMVNAFAHLIDNDFQKLIQILYKADVDQDKLKFSLENTENASSATVIANAYLDRQKAKVETWKKYSSG